MPRSTRYAERAAPAAPCGRCAPTAPTSTTVPSRPRPRDWRRLRRFLVLGTDGSAYRAGSRPAPQRYGALVERCLRGDGPRLVAEILAVRERGRAARDAPALFALALAAATGDLATRRAAQEALGDVARTSEELFAFVGYAGELDAWGRSLRRALGRWYGARSPDALGREAVACGARSRRAQPPRRPADRLPGGPGAGRVGRARPAAAMAGPRRPGAGAPAGRRGFRAAAGRRRSRLRRRARARLPAAAPGAARRAPRLGRGLVGAARRHAAARAAAQPAADGVGGAARARLGRGRPRRDAVASPGARGRRRSRAGRRPRGAARLPSAARPSPSPRSSRPSTTVFHGSLAHARAVGRAAARRARRLAVDARRRRRRDAGRQPARGGGRDGDGERRERDALRRRRLRRRGAAAAAPRRRRRSAVPADAAAAASWRSSSRRGARVGDVVAALSRLPAGDPDYALPMRVAADRGLDVDLFVVYTDSDALATETHARGGARRVPAAVGDRRAAGRRRRWRRRASRSPIRASRGCSTSSASISRCRG